MAPNPELSYLDRVVMEIIETERTYVRDLRSIVEDYLAHIIDTADLPIVPEQVCALFGNIEDIYEFNSELLQELDHCENDPVEIARCFVLKSDYFEIYTQYCTNYPNSVAALTECMRNKRLLQFFMERQEVLQHPLPLGSYLLKPVQRILKYHLLLQEIAKHFDPDGDGYDVVEEAINTMTEVAWYINSMKRKHEHAVRLQEVQSLLINWRGPDLTTYGELVLEGTFRFHHAKNDRTLFLFDQVLLITKRRGENFIYKTHISCSMLMLMEGLKDSLSFSVTHYKHPKHPHVVQARTMEEKKLWTHHIKRLILENHHTAIPQKAKDAILEMDSVYPKSRFHAERKKKTQSDDFTHTRHSDITKLKNSKAASLKHSISEGQLCTDLPPHELGEWGSTSGSEALSFCEEGKQQEVTVLAPEGEQEENGSEDGITEDFSSAMISCWSFRAKALLQRHLQEEENLHYLPEQQKHPQISHQGSVHESQIQLNQTDLKSAEELKPESDGETPQNTDQVYNSTASEETRDLDSEVKAEDAVNPNQDVQSSEEEEEETEDENHSILPSSVLDKASAIAEHYISSVRRSSTAAEELRSPRRAHTQEVTIQNSPDLNFMPSREEAVSGSSLHLNGRRDSTLSKQDLLIIAKIRSYYESAEQDDVGFSLRRRESLSYIPNGLVSTSISKFNKRPVTSPARMTSSAPEYTRSISSSSELQNQIPDQGPSRTHVDGSVNQRSENFSEETFHHPSEMISVWQEMEREVTRSPRRNKFRDTSSTVLQRSTRISEHEESIAEDLSTITEESPAKVTAADEKHSSEGSVFHLARKFSHRVRNRKLVNQPKKWSSDSTDTFNHTDLSPLKEEPNHIRERQNLTRSLSSDLTIKNRNPSPAQASSSSVSSPRLSASSPPLPPFEGFHWPDVRELRSKYAQLEAVSLTHAANTHMQVERAGSLDQKLGVFGWSDVNNKKVQRDHYITAQLPLPNHRTITVLEKRNTTHPHRPVPVYSPTSQTSASLPSISQRCRAYEDLDETPFRAGPARRTNQKKKNKTVREGSNVPADGVQQGVVKNLRKKFSSLR